MTTPSDAYLSGFCRAIVIVAEMERDARRHYVEAERFGECYAMAKEQARLTTLASVREALQDERDRFVEQQLSSPVATMLHGLFQSLGVKRHEAQPDG